MIEFKLSIPQIDTQTGTPRDSGGGIYGFQRSGLAKQVIDNTHSIERLEQSGGGTPGTPPPGLVHPLVDLYDSDTTADTLPTFTANFFRALQLSTEAQVVITQADETDILEVLIFCQKATSPNAFSAEAFEIAIWKWNMLGHVADSESTTGGTGDTWTKLSIRIQNASGTATDTVGMARGVGNDVLVYTSDTNNSVPVRVVIKLKERII